MTSKKGFTPPNYTQAPNTLFDLMAVMSNAELRITLALVRETFGWHRQRTDQMSVAELAGLAGLSESSAKTGIKEGEKRGSIKRFRGKDDRNRPTYRYGLVVSDATNFEVFERPRTEAFADAPDEAESGLTSQILTRSEFDPVKISTGQILTPSPESLTGQILTPSYKEERNLLVSKEKREAATPPALSEPTFEAVGGEGPAAVKDEAPLSSPEFVQIPPQVGNIDDQSPEQVAGGGAAAAGGEVEKYLRRKLSNSFISNLLEETAPLGVDRRRDWFSLPLERVKEIEKDAQVMASKSAGNRRVPTCFKELLDEEAQTLGLPARPGHSAGANLTLPPEDPDADPLAALLAGASLNGTRGRR